MWSAWCFKRISEYRRNRIRIIVMCTECLQTRGSSHEGSDPGCIRIPHAAMFGYVVGDVVAHLLEKVWRILVARSSGTRL
jgi:hypothetical protein